MLSTRTNSFCFVVRAEFSFSVRRVARCGCTLRSTGWGAIKRGHVQKIRSNAAKPGGVSCAQCPTLSLFVALALVDPH